MLNGQGRAKRGDCVLDAAFVQGYDIGVTLHDDGDAGTGHGRLRLIKAVKNAGFMEKRRFLRVQVLRLAIADDAAPKCDAFPLGIVNGEHDSVVKPVVNAAAVTLNGNVGLDHLVCFETEG